MIIWEGESVLTGEPIAAIATFGSRNRKTGDMVQVWIIRSDMDPQQAAQAGLDRAVCGDCPHRPANLDTCYLLLWREVNSVFQAYQRGSYEPFSIGAFNRRRVRFGAYGDPAAVPTEVWLQILAVCNVKESTGYTHQLNTVKTGADPAIAQFCQISVDTVRQARRAWSLGYKTFRVMTGREQELLPGEVLCDNVETGVMCADCGRCNGATSNVAIPPHGPKAHILARSR